MNATKSPPDYRLTTEQLEAFKKLLKKQIVKGKQPEQSPLHNLKDRVFTKLFAEVENQIALYSALHPDEEPPTADEIVLVTLQSVVSTHSYNDLGLLVRGRVLILVEAQSTWSLNIVLRSLMYLIHTWKDLITCTNENVYGTKPVVLPSFESYVIFTGNRQNQPEWLSFKDIYPAEGNGGLDFRVRCIYKKDGGDDIIQQYIQFTNIWDEQSQQFDKAHQMDALRETIEICLKRGILTQFITKRRAEIMDIATLLFDQDEVTRRTNLEIWNDGKDEGMRIGKDEGMRIGKDEGMRIGKDEGMRVGKDEGEKQKALDIARSLKLMNVAEEIIAQSTGLTPEQIEKI